MLSLLFSISGLYLLVTIGYIWKKYVAPDLNERHLSLLMIYFLSPGLVFWGLSAAPITTDVARIGLFYMLACVIVLFILLAFSRAFKLGPRKRAVLIMNNVLVNTGNLGIPIGLAFIGTASLPYTTATNMVAMVLSYTVGVYFYSRGAFSIMDSFVNILKLPVLWVAALAIIINLQNITLAPVILDFLEIIGHTSIGFQLITLGVFLAAHLGTTKDWAFLGQTLSIKLWLLPAVTLGVIYLFQVEGLVAQVLFLQSLMPAAVNNLNLASLYKCRPEAVTPVVFWSSVIGLVSIPFGLWLWQ